MCAQQGAGQEGPRRCSPGNDPARTITSRAINWMKRRTFSYLPGSLTRIQKIEHSFFVRAVTPEVEEKTLHLTIN
jgi:hypothetical protein